MAHEIASAAISGGSNLISGLFGLAAQKKANQTNLAIARETNAANERINQANIAYQWKALQEQQRYGSYANQMAMAREAGINPYSVLGNPAAGGVSGTPVSHAMQAAQVSPENAMATAIGRSSQDAATMVAAIAQARKADAETQGIKTDNLYKAAQQEADLNLKGLQGAAQKLANEFAEQNNPLLLRAQEINNQYLTNQTRLLQLEEDIKTFYKDTIQPQELNQILEAVKLAQEQQRTEISKQELNRASGKAQLTSAAANMLQARISQYLAESQKELNESQASLNNQHTKLLEQETRIKRMFDGKVYDALLEQVNSGNRINEATLENIYKKNQLLQKDMDFYTFKSIVGSLIPIGAVAKIFGVGTTPLHISGFGQ